MARVLANRPVDTGCVEVDDPGATRTDPGGRTDMTKTPDPLDEFLATLPSLRLDEFMVLAAAHRQPDPARDVAWKAARAVIAREGLDAEVEDLRSTIIAWAIQPVSTPTQWAEIPMGSGPAEQDSRRAAAPSLLDAAIALYLGDALDISDRDALLGPWRRLWADEAPAQRTRRAVPS